MSVGGIIFLTVKVGEMDLLNGDASFHGIDIFEDITDPFSSPLIEINVVDPSDALNKHKITGSYDENPIEIKFKYEPTGEIVGFKARMHSNVNQMDNMGNDDRSSGHHKQYQIRGVQEEVFRANGANVEKAFSGPTTEHVKKIFERISDKDVVNGDNSEPRDKLFGRVGTKEAIQQLLKEHTSSKYQSSAYTIFQEWKNGNPKIVQTTYEQLFEQNSVVTLKERTDLNTSGISEEDHQNSIMWAEYDPSFSASRPMSKAVKKSYNPSTGVVVDENYQQDTKSKKPAYNSPASYADKFDVRHMEDTANNGQPHNNADAKRKRAQYLSHLMQGSARIEIPGNPKITLGCKITLDVPKKTDDNQSGGEGQMNKECIVVSIRHKIKPAGQEPRYTMILELVKAGMEKGGNSA